MEIIEEHTSLRGRSVTISRIPAPMGRTQIRVAYDEGKFPGRVAYYPDRPKFQPLIEEVKEYFLEDRDKLGSPFAVVSPRLRGQLRKGRALQKMRGSKTRERTTLDMDEGFDMVEAQLAELEEKVTQVKKQLKHLDWLDAEVE